MAHTKRAAFLADRHVRMPEVLAEAVERAADRHMMTSSEYVRQAIIARLQAEKLAQLDIHDDEGEK
jgi:hypothetical protein